MGSSIMKTDIPREQLQKYIFKGNIASPSSLDHDENNLKHLILPTLLPTIENISTIFGEENF